MRLFTIPHTLYPIPLLLLLCLAAGVPAFADGTINMANPSAGTGWTFAGNVVTITANGNYTVTGTSTTNRIVIDKNVTATITLNNANIHSAVASPFALSSDTVAGGNGSQVTLILSGSNELVSTHVDSPGLQVEDNARLIIEGSGSLTAQGGDLPPNTGGGAGIGSGDHQRAGIIIINSGTVTATGGLLAAGIGGGGTGDGGNVTITGGTVTATGGKESAGIGGGTHGDGGNITINGGVVVAISLGGGGDPAGIGGGGWGGGAGTINITGGTVYACGGSGAGIGGGSRATEGVINITGGTVIADEIGIGAIGQTYESRTATNISGAKTIVLSPSINTETFGGATVLTGYNVDVSGSITAGDTVADVALHADLTIPSGCTLIVPEGIVFDVNHRRLTVNGELVRQGQVINEDYIPPVRDINLSALVNTDVNGDGWVFRSNVVTITGSGDRTITGSTDAVRVVIEKNVIATITLDNVHIHSSTASPISLSSDDTGGSLVTLRLVGSNELVTTGARAAGLWVPNNARLTIEGPGSLVAMTPGGIGDPAGIGGDGFGSTGTIKITGGTVYASGGTGPGIGAGAGATEGVIHITGGTVIADEIGIGNGRTETYISGANTIALSPSINATTFGGAQVLTGTNIGVSCSVAGENIDYKVTLHADLTIPSGCTLIVPEGIVFDVNHRRLTVNGELVRQGQVVNEDYIPPVRDINLSALDTDVDNRDGWTYFGNVVTITGSGNRTITGSTDAVRVVIEKDVTATITLDNVRIHSAVASPFSLSSDTVSGSQVTLRLVGNSELVTTAESAGLRVENKARLTIEGTGSLTASGGVSGAGIGGGIYSSGGTITIRGGTVVATSLGGNGDPAAIGGGGYGNAGTINITGGIVYASGGTGAGIGSAGRTTGGIINITGGMIIATGGGQATGIGGGPLGNVDTITISGGTVVAVTPGGDGDPAGIGGGRYGSSAGTINITGGTVYASGGPGSGIGAGATATGGVINITGGAVIADEIGMGKGRTETHISGANTIVLSQSINTASFGGAQVLTGTGIGISCSVAGGNIDYKVTLNADLTIPSGCTLTVPAGIVFDVNHRRLTVNGELVRQGQVVNEDYIPPVRDINLSALDTDVDNRDGWTYFGNVVTITGSGDRTITGSTDAVRVVIEKDVTATITLDNVRIHSAVASPFSLSSDTVSGSQVTLRLVGNSELVTTAESAGLRVENKARLTIEGAGSLTASGGVSGAGIGGGIYSSGGTITISGGTVVATSLGGPGDPAAIGGGGYGKAGTINITGGIVYATVGSGTGIGGGAGATGGIINITGGMITATGGDFATGIGGGRDGAGGNITITGGTITATGGSSGAGIGGGYGGDGGNITITGGTITAIAGQYAAGIGGGYGGDGGNISISNGIIVSVSVGSTGDPAGIGGGGKAGAGTINITGGTVYASGGTGAGIGGGANATGGVINITGGTVIADEIGVANMGLFNESRTATNISGASTLVLSQSINTESFGGATVLTGTHSVDVSYMKTGDGSDVILNAGLTVPSGCTLVVPVGIVFNVNYKKLINNGVIREYGTIKNANQRLGNPIIGAIQQDWITISAQTYTGNPIEPAVTISYGGLTLAQGVDYSVACTNNVNAGTATATITDWGDNHTISAPFTIARRPVSAEWLTVPAQPYTGSALTPAVTVTDGSRTLTLNKDYTVAYPVPAATNAGTYEVGITGMGNYTGSASKPFTINPKALAAGGIAALSAQTYTGVTIEPAVTVTDGDKELEEDKDYTVAYTNNVNAGTATATATGAGNYGGTISKDFTINPKALSAGAIQEISAQSWTGDSVTPAVVVRDGSRTLTPGVDYTITYNNNVQAGKGMATITGRGNYAGSAVGYFDILSGEIASEWILDVPAQTYTGKPIEPAVTVRNGSKTLTAGTDYTITYSKNVQAGVATVRVTGWGNYTGNAYGYFDILPREIAVEWIEDVPAQTWTGRAITPAVTVRDGDRTLTSGTDYTVTYANNVNVGPEAWVSVTGMGNYAGTQSKKFSINVSQPTDTVPADTVPTPPPPADTVSKAVTGVSFYNDNYIVEKGQTLQMVAIVVPADAGNRNVSWATSNRAVATVSGGRVTAVSAGEATITVTTADGGYRDACLIRVPGKVTTKDTVIYQKIIFYERDTLYRDTTVTLMDTLYTDTTVHRVDTLYRDTTFYITDTLYRDTTVCLTDTLYNDTVIYVANIVHADSIDYTLVPDTVYVATDITGAEDAFITATARVVRVGTGLRIEGLTPGKTFGIYRVTGEKLYSGTAQSDVFRLDNIPAGVYILYHAGQYSKFSY
ncbi:MAG: hypothetical protein MdMp024_1349 [Bacteroidales bacterium]